MKKHFLPAAAFFVAFAGADCAKAADIALPAAAPVPYRWSGFYLGLNAGGVLGSYNLNTSTTPGTYLPNPADIAAINAAGIMHIKPPGFTGGTQAGYNWQSGNWVVGIEGDVDFLHLKGAPTSGAVPYPVGPRVFVQAFSNGIGIVTPINQFVITDYADADWLATLRPRVGFSKDNWLFYVTGGLALTTLRQDFLFTDGVAALALGYEQGARTTALKAGSVVGLGVETALINNLSFKAEYLHVDFGNTSAMQTFNAPGIPAVGRTQSFVQSGDLSADMIRLGLNYRFGNSAVAATPGMPVKAAVWKAVPAVASSWEFEAGTRLWFSTGSVGAPQPLLGFPPPPSNLLSRLTYTGLDAVTGEVFARVEHSSGVFVKGFLGAGGIYKGGLFDEDFPGGGAYSNTLSGDNSGHIGYATADLGYDFVRSAGARLGTFVGYNYYDQAVNTYGCIQLAGAGVCQPAGSVPSTILGLSEDDHFNSLRVGLATEFKLTDRLTLTADAAYLPRVEFGGLNHHNARELLLPETANSGDGVMVETVLNYQIVEGWNVGAGGRYWAWNSNTGNIAFNNLGLAGLPLPLQLARYTTERYGGFLQASYQWGDTTPRAVANPGSTTKAPPLPAPPVSWTGIYAGSYLGGGKSGDRWSDPFGPTPGPTATNLPGFGDTINATGPLGGVQVGVNWQSGALVLGVQADAGLAHLRGENTCFSGLGGINCARNVNSLETVTGRAGFAWGRSLVYAKGGAAWTNDTFTLDANTNGFLALGTGTTKLNTQGWIEGGGVEYALTDHWSALVEYDHITLPSAVIPFPTVAVINGQTISVRQGIEVMKVGVNYKFGLPLPPPAAPNG